MARTVSRLLRGPSSHLGATVSLCCVLLMTLAGCTSDKRPSAPPISIHSGSVAPGAEGQSSSTAGICKIVAGADVANAYGGSVSNVSGGTNATGKTTCVFTLSQSNVGLGQYNGNGRVSLLLDATATAVAFKQAQAALAGAVAVTGVGDQAFYGATSTNSSLQFLKGTTWVVITSELIEPAAKQTNPAILKTDAIALAKVISAQI
jgi:hypothetical protein